MLENIERRPLLGIFAGGAGRRMGGIDKGALEVPGQRVAIMEHHVALAAELRLDCALLGARPLWQSRLPQCQHLDDDPCGIGPLGGLHALLQAAGDRPAIALACDMPYVTAKLLRMLMDYPQGAAIVAPKELHVAKWQPLFARYEPHLVLPAIQRALGAKEHSLQALFDKLQVEELVLPNDLHAKLSDWDLPEDVEHSRD